VTQDDLLYRFRLRTFAIAAELGNVRAACRAMGIHPSTYYRWKRQLDRHGPEILRPLVRHRATLDDQPELAAGSLGDVEQRPERARGEERVASAPEDPRRSAALFAEPPDQRRLADACLAANQQDLAARAALHALQAIDQH
jgi:transposase-like protein